MTSTYKESEKTEAAYQNTQPLHNFTIEEAEQYKNNLLYFLGALQRGESQTAHEIMMELIYHSNMISFQTVEDCHTYLSYINLSCHLAVLNTNVHPTHVMKLYFSLEQKIHSLTNRKDALDIANDICRKYSLLVRNYSFSNYSKNIRSVINYIHLHLDEELSLTKLAEYAHKNASALSALFSKEVGMSITNYIHQTRIDKAIFYFNTTKMSVSEVSLAVGIQDFAYFSKLFRKQVGCSPREYCKQLN